VSRLIVSKAEWRAYAGGGSGQEPKNEREKKEEVGNGVL